MKFNNLGSSESVSNSGSRNRFQSLGILTFLIILIVCYVVIAKRLDDPKYKAEDEHAPPQETSAPAAAAPAPLTPDQVAAQIKAKKEQEAHDKAEKEASDRAAKRAAAEMKKHPKKASDDPEERWWDRKPTELAAPVPQAK